ncbi:hypothetical protein FGB62_271g032 [Gracilaria domingensis]|nr:hypothetical protein FGB62_271g032 [Gracilaria domingensis]
MDTRTTCIRSHAPSWERLRSPPSLRRHSEQRRRKPRRWPGCSTRAPAPNSLLQSSLAVSNWVSTQLCSLRPLYVHTQHSDDMKSHPTAPSADGAGLRFSSVPNGSSSQQLAQNGVSEETPQPLKQNGLVHSPVNRNKRPLEPGHDSNALSTALERSTETTASQTDAAAASALPSPQRHQLGKRKRKKTRMFEITAPTHVRRMNTGALGVTGRGEKLCNIPNILYNIEKAHSKDVEIEFLHRLLFNFVGAMHSRKSNIRSFSGFMFSSEKERNRVRDKLKRAHLNMVRKVAKFLDVPISKPSRAGDQMNGELASDEHTNEPVTNARESPQPSLALNGQKRALLADDDGISEACHDVNRANASAQTSQNNARETIMTAGKDYLVRVLLEFLEEPRLIEGRESLADRDKELRRQKKAAEKARAQKAALKKAAEKKAALLKKKEMRESDEDGDEDLENGGTTWIELARQWKETKEREENASKRNGFLTTNGHG